jgi:TldD protein
VAPTGSARAAVGEAPRARQSNTFLANGAGDLAALLGGVGLGLYLAEPVGVSCDESRAVLRAGAGRMIRSGELAEPIKGASIAGHPLALLGGVDALAGDFRWDPSARSCAHGARGPVAVSTGAPHVRLVEAPVGEDA